MLYWAIALPHRVGVGSGFIVGIVLDVLTGTLLGQHALGLSIVTFIAIQLHQRIRVFPFWQQSLGMLVLLRDRASAGALGDWARRAASHPAWPTGPCR